MVSFFRNMYLRLPEDSIILGIYLDVPGRKLGSMVTTDKWSILGLEPTDPNHFIPGRVL